MGVRPHRRSRRRDRVDILEADYARMTSLNGAAAYLQSKLTVAQK
jgi:hypothetical protein